MSEQMAGHEVWHQENQFNRRMHQWDSLPVMLEELREMIGGLSSSSGGDGVHSGATGSRAPWNAPAAHAYFDVHAEIRRVESLLSVVLFQRAVYRGGSDAATAEVFARLPVLLREAFDRDPESEVLDEALSALIGLARRIRVLLNPDERRTRAPWVRCHLCDGTLWIYAAGQDVNPRINSEHFEPGAAYCNACAVFYPGDVWQRVAAEIAGVA